MSSAPTTVLPSGLMSTVSGEAVEAGQRRAQRRPLSRCPRGATMPVCPPVTISVRPSFEMSADIHAHVVDGNGLHDRSHARCPSSRSRRRRIGQSRRDHELRAIRRERQIWSTGCRRRRSVTRELVRRRRSPDVDATPRGLWSRRARRRPASLPSGVNFEQPDRFPAVPGRSPSSVPRSDVPEPHGALLCVPFQAADREGRRVRAERQPLRVPLDTRCDGPRGGRRYRSARSCPTPRMRVWRR